METRTLGGGRNGVCNLGKAANTVNPTIPRSSLRERALTWVQHKWDDSEEMRLSARRFFKAHVTFYRLHLVYFCVIATVGTLLVWLSPKPNGPIAVIDALFGVTSALCVTGLFSLRMEKLSRFDKVVLMFLMLLGCQVFTSLLPVYVRRFYFKSYIRKYLKLGSEAPSTAPDDLEKDLAGHEPARQVGGPWKASSLEHIFDDNRKFLSFKSPRSEPPSWFEDQHTDEDSVYHTWSGETSKEEAKKFALVMHISKALSSRLDAREEQTSPKKNSKEREIGEDDIFLDSSSSKVVEHEALIYLSWLVPIYFLGVQLTSFSLIELYFLGAPHARQSLEERDVNRTFFSMFTSVSAFANAGLSLIDDNMVPFQKSVLLLLIYCFLILVGNTLFPVCMRFIIWMLYRLSKGNRKLVFKYLLRHPRKCYTHLFPRRHTIWLAATVMAINSVEFIAFCALDWRSSALKGLGAGYKMVDGIFQSVSTRSAGFQVVFLAQLSSAMLVLTVGMMYIAAYPIFLSRQNSMAPREVYDESDLGVYGRNWEAELVQSRLSWQARTLLARDSYYLFVAVFLICVIHNKQIKKDPLNFSIFNIIFEVISAYGNVGLSVGYSCDLAHMLDPNRSCKDVPYSFSGKWSPAGKAILVVVMFLGRHRGLPENIDSAIKLPRRKEFAVKRTRSLSRFRDPVLWTSFKGRGGPGAYSSSAPPHTTSPSQPRQVSGATGETTGTPVAGEPRRMEAERSLSPSRYQGREEISQSM